MNSPTYKTLLIRRIRLLLLVMMAGLIASGVTAFPIETEIDWLTKIISADASTSALAVWLIDVRAAVTATNRSYPFLGYGTDWLAFAHLAIAALFIGPWHDPLRNRWVIDWGLITCAGIVPLALVAGALRGIPFFWQLIDCSFGVLGAIPLWFCRRYIVKLEGTVLQES